MTAVWLKNAFLGRVNYDSTVCAAHGHFRVCTHTHSRSLFHSWKEVNVAHNAVQLHVCIAVYVLLSEFGPHYQTLGLLYGLRAAINLIWCVYEYQLACGVL